MRSIVLCGNDCPVNMCIDVNQCVGMLLGELLLRLVVLMLFGVDVNASPINM